MEPSTPDTPERTQAKIRSKLALSKPERRPLKIFASDPMAGYTAGNRITISVPNDYVGPGPCGERLEVIDFDGAHRCFYPPIDLDDDGVLMRSGLDPAESDPRFHQQMVYAVALYTLENFDRALGRPIDFSKRKYKRLRLFPHAFHGSNAYYERNLNGVLFGYFRADRANPGNNLPNQMVFTCLSHDIIAHELTHAVVDRLRPYLLEPTNVDVLAFHEGFSDIVALFQHFTFTDLVYQAVQKQSTKLETPGPLVELAQQFGHATGGGQALRSALNKDVKLTASLAEPHARGSILVAAVFDGFFKTYQTRIRDLVRIATGGTGRLPEGDLHPDLVRRIASEASRTAQSILSMAIRAFDYLPPVDVTFGDYLRALITADYELLGSDDSIMREAMIEAFRVRNIYPDDVTSLAQESLIWSLADQVPPIPIGTNSDVMNELVLRATYYGRARGNATADPTGEDRDVSEEGIEINVSRKAAEFFHQYADVNRAALRLHPEHKIQVAGFHPVFRTANNGQLLVEFVVQYVQTDKSLEEDLGGLPFRGGTTVIAGFDGRVRYVIAKPMPHANADPLTLELATRRMNRQRGYLELSDQLDPAAFYAGAAQYRNRMAARGNLAALHVG